MTTWRLDDDEESDDELFWETWRHYSLTSRTYPGSVWWILLSTESLHWSNVPRSHEAKSFPDCRSKRVLWLQWRGVLRMFWVCWRVVMRAILNWVLLLCSFAVDYLSTTLMKDAQLKEWQLDPKDRWGSDAHKFSSRNITIGSGWLLHNYEPTCEMGNFLHLPRRPCDTRGRTWELHFPPASSLSCELVEFLRSFFMWSVVSIGTLIRELLPNQNQMTMKWESLGDRRKWISKQERSEAFLPQFLVFLHVRLEEHAQEGIDY